MEFEESSLVRLRCVTGDLERMDCLKMRENRIVEAAGRRWAADTVAVRNRGVEVESRSGVGRAKLIPHVSVVP